MKPSDLFTDLTPQGRELMLKAMRTHDLPKGLVAVEKGQKVSGAYFVLDGELRVFTLTPAGREATLYLIRPGETCVLALNSLFNNLLYPAWVQAVEPTIVGIVPGAAYRALFERERPIQDLTVRALSTIVFRLMSELEQIHSCRLDQRLAAFLLTHASGEGVLAKTQQEIAAHVGSTREGVARIMAEFAASGWVETKRGTVRLLRPQELAALTSSG